MELVDVSTAVLSYMNLFSQALQRTGENGKILLSLLAISSLNDFQVGGDDYNLIVARIKEIYGAVNSLERSRILRTTDKAGVYGTIYTDPSEPSAVYKVIELPTDEARRLTFMLSFLKETFIQHLLSSDQELGKHVPKVLGIYKNVTTGMPTALTIKMEKSNITLQKRIQNKIKREQTLTLAYMQPILTNIIRLMLKLQDKYHFTHRDLKSNNIMYREGVLQLIDFGMACIHFRAFGTEYNVINNVYHTSRSKCLIEQDIALLLLNLQLLFSDKFDASMKTFMDSVGMPNFLNILNKLKAEKNAAGQQVRQFNIAYNRNDVLYKRSNVGPNFKPEFVLSKLGELIFTGAPAPDIQVEAKPTILQNTRKNFINNATRIRPPMPMTQMPQAITQKPLNNTRKRITQKGFLIGTQSSPTHYALMPLRAVRP